MKQKTEFIPLNTQLIDYKSFDCGKSAINQYLRRYAAKNMKIGLSSTFVLPYQNTINSPDSQSAIAAFYTLANQSVATENIPTAKNLPRYPTPVILLAQLGVDKKFQGTGLGTKTLVTALQHAYLIANSPGGIPSFGVILDALDENALSFYQSFDCFIPFPGNPMRLFAPMNMIDELIDQAA